MVKIALSIMIGLMAFTLISAFCGEDGDLCASDNECCEERYCHGVTRRCTNTKFYHGPQRKSNCLGRHCKSDNDCCRGDICVGGSNKCERRYIRILSDEEERDEIPWA